jgi:DNA-binding winged helix-turn-helix (wHTH) protein/Tol biopolymer transport system component
LKVVEEIMKDVRNRSYRFADVEIDVQNLRVTVGSEIRPLEPKSFRLLLFLIENPGRALPKEEIMAVVWPDAFVSDNSLARAIAQIRKALDDDPKSPKYAETVPSVGYRFLADVKEETKESSEAPSAPEPSVEPTGVPVRRVPVNPWLIAGASAVIAISAVMFVYFRGIPRTDQPETRSEIDTPPTSDPRSFAISPDGRKLAYVATENGQSWLWVRQLASTKAQPLAVTEGGAAYAFWSPDSRSIGYFSAGKLRRIDASGGSAQIVADARSARGGTWNADGVILFAPTSSGPLFRVPATGGDAVAVTKLAAVQGSHRFPAFLPDGKHFLFYDEGRPGLPGLQVGVREEQLQQNGAVLSVCLGTLGSGEIKVLTKANSAGLYMPPGWLLWVRAGTLVARRLDIAQGELSGDTIPVADPVLSDTSHARLFSVSETGLVTYRSGVPATQIRWFDRTGKALGTFAEPPGDGMFSSVGRLSPDGRRAAIARNVRGQYDYWLIDETHSNRFTFNFPGLGHTAWSPDGGEVAIDGFEPGPGTRNFRFYTKAADGSHDAVPVAVPLPNLQSFDDWSPDGSFLLYQTIDPKTGRDLWTMPLGGDHQPRVFLQTKFDEKDGRFSPDSRWVAYTSNVSGRSEVYIRAFNGAADASAGSVFQVSLDGGLFATWRRDGKELYWVGPGGRMMAAPIIVKGATLESGPPVEIFQAPIFNGGLDVNTGGREFDVGPDGRFLINTVKDGSATAITLLQNWKPK